jgi:hypothetical protein
MTAACGVQLNAAFWSPEMGGFFWGRHRKSGSASGGHAREMSAIGGVGASENFKLKMFRRVDE